MTYEQLRLSIEERLLGLACLYNEVTTSDLRGMAAATAVEIIADCRLAEGAD